MNSLMGVGGLEKLPGWKLQAELWLCFDPSIVLGSLLLKEAYQRNGFSGFFSFKEEGRWHCSCNDV